MQAGSVRPRQVQWYHPGEVVVVARVRRDMAVASNDLQGLIPGLLGDQAQAMLAEPGSTRSFAFGAPDEDRALVFVFHKLSDRQSAAGVKQAVEAIHQGLTATPGAAIQVVAAMPHFHLRAHEGYSGASPGSYPRPVYRDKVPANWTDHHYAPSNPRFAMGDQGEAIRVAVLDAVPDLDRAYGSAAHLRNPQLRETIDWLRRNESADGAAAYQAERENLAEHHDSSETLADEPRAYHQADHGLFVAGLIHGVAPRARLTLEPVLDELGNGDLSLLLIGLQRVLERKQPGDPQIINLSLGFMPHPARLPAAWLGLDRPHDPAFVPASDLYDPRRDRSWLAENGTAATRTVDLLEIGLRELGRYLSLNNCLVVAAAGNDSLQEVERRQARMEPRLPARFESVLGVAATTSDPKQPARYSNIGDERELGDHVATFGGNASDGLEPEDGVIGLFSGDFPDGKPNETGWAYWSGTSFATAIVSGLAANYWATRRVSRPGERAADILHLFHDEASASGPYVQALRTPAIEVLERWKR